MTATVHSIALARLRRARALPPRPSRRVVELAAVRHVAVDGRIRRELNPRALERIDELQHERRLRMDRVANAAGLCPRCQLPLACAEHWFAFDARSVATHVECKEGRHGA